MSLQGNRRNVLFAGAAASAFTIVPSSVLAQSAKKNSNADRDQLPPSERLNLAFVGLGGKGKANTDGLKKHNMYSFAEVYPVAGPKNKGGLRQIKAYPEARLYDDWRVMLDKDAKNLDGVVVTTPDHTHAVITMAAMKLGLPVYTEKPLTRTISESRALAEYARENNIVTQMGNQGHSNADARMAVEWIRAGVLGDVREVHCWTNRPVWPQGIARPVAEIIPAEMNWDVWLGPAPDAPFSSEIAPFKWRAFWEYGCGALGDMAAHIIDHPVWALDLGAPVSVEVSYEPSTAAAAADTYPVSTEVVFEFAARGNKPPVKMKWFDGQNFPPRPEGLEEARKMQKNGIIYYGDKYDMMQEVYGKSPRIFPETDMRAAVPELKKVEKTLPRTTSHYDEWVDAIKANDPSLALSNFDYAGPLTEMMLLGCVATRVGPGTKLTWDSENMTTNNDLANRYVHHEYRKGWSL